MTPGPRNQGLSPVITLVGEWSGDQDLPPVIQPWVVAAVRGHLIVLLVVLVVVG